MSTGHRCSHWSSQVTLPTIPRRQEPPSVVDVPGRAQVWIWSELGYPRVPCRQLREGGNNHTIELLKWLRFGFYSRKLTRAPWVSTQRVGCTNQRLDVVEAGME